MTDARHIEAQIYERLSKVIDPELRPLHLPNLGMIAAIKRGGRYLPGRRRRDRHMT